MLPLQFQQPAPHDEARPIGGHVRFGAMCEIKGGVRIGGFEDVAILINDGGVPIDQRLRRALLLGARYGESSWISWMRPSSIGVAQLMMMWRMPLG